MAHSQGCILSRHALKYLSSEIQDKIYSVPIAPGSSIPEDCRCKEALNLYDSRDIVGAGCNVLHSEEKYLHFNVENAVLKREEMLNKGKTRTERLKLYKETMKARHNVVMGYAPFIQKALENVANKKRIDTGMEHIMRSIESHVV